MVTCVYNCLQYFYDNIERKLACVPPPHLLSSKMCQ
jgi:hypothetical protein